MTHRTSIISVIIMHSRRLAFTKVPSGHGSNFRAPRVAFAKPARFNESRIVLTLTGA